MRQHIEKLSRALVRASSSLQSPLLLIIRAYWGWQFVGTGWGKLENPAKVAHFFASLGIPFPAFNAHFVSLLEFAGGLLLILGLGSRLIALLLSIDMFVAYAAADREALFSFFSNPDRFMAAAPYGFLFASLIVLAFGAGAISVDGLIAWKLKRSRTLSSASPGAARDLDVREKGGRQ